MNNKRGSGKRVRKIMTPPPPPCSSTGQSSPASNDVFGGVGVNIIAGADTPPPPARKRSRRGPTGRIFLADEGDDGSSASTGLLASVSNAPHSAGPLATTVAAIPQRVYRDNLLHSLPRDMDAVTAKPLLEVPPGSTMALNLEGEGDEMKESHSDSSLSSSPEDESRRTEKRENKLLDQAEGLSGTALRDFLSNQFMDGLDEIDNVLARWT